MKKLSSGVVGLLAIAVAACGGDTTTTVIETTPTETVTETTTAEITTTAATTSESTETTTEAADAPAPEEDPSSPAAAGVPDVVGLLAPDARLALKAAGYELFANTGSPTRDYVDPGGPKERVCAQAPEAGAMAPAGTRVTIVIREKCGAFGG